MLRPLLEQRQQQFAQAIQRSATNTAGLSSQHVSAEQALQVYQNNYLLSLQEALALGYPVIQALVGEESFCSLSRQFALSHPMQQAYVAEYGEEFADYLQQLVEEHPDFATLPYLADLARFEWAIERCCNLPFEDEPLALESLQQRLELEAEQTRLPLASDLILFTSPYPVNRIYQMVKSETVEQLALDLPCYVLLKKTADFDAELIELSEQSYGFLSHCQSGAPLTELSEALAAELQQHLLQAIEQQWLTKRETEEQ